MHPPFWIGAENLAALKKETDIPFINKDFGGSKIILE
jgi:hypothetical protein